MNSLPRCDVAIVGGGPAGSATAVALAEQGFSTTVVDSSPATAPRAGETVPADIEPLLARLGVREEFARAGHLRVAATASAWGTAELSWQDAFTSALGGGWHLRRLDFDESLVRTAALRGATVLRGWRVADVRARPDRGWTLALRANDGGARRLEASFVVDATGRAARVARRLGERTLVVDRLVCISALLGSPPDAPASVHTVVESAEDGWWYSGRLPDGRTVTAFFTDADILRRRSIRGPASWHESLRRTRHLFALLGRPPVPAALRIDSARSQRLGRMCGHRWLAVGEASTAWDPLTSSGIVLALRSGLQAGQTIPRLLAGDQDAGTRYERDLLDRHARYLDEHAAYYSLEGRWPASEFWARRRRVAAEAPS